VLFLFTRTHILAISVPRAAHRLHEREKLMGLDLEITMASAPIAVKASVSIFSKFLGAFTSEAEVVFSVKGHNYQRAKGVFKKREQGLSSSLTIRGTGPFCLAVLSYLVSVVRTANLPTQIFNVDYTPVDFASTLVKQSYTSQLADILRRTDTMAYRWTGENYHHEEVMWGLWVNESGSMIDVSVKGKRGFVQLAFKHLYENPQIMNLVLNFVVAQANQAKVVQSSVSSKVIDKP
jgi:hypothetical protein